MSKSILLDLDGENLLRDMVFEITEVEIRGQIKTPQLRIQLNQVLEPYYAVISDDFKYIDFENIRDKSYFLLKFS